jgi:Flp pilus assembly protein TadB
MTSRRSVLLRIEVAAALVAGGFLMATFVIGATGPGVWVAAAIVILALGRVAWRRARSPSPNS